MLAHPMRPIRLRLVPPPSPTCLLARRPGSFVYGVVSKSLHTPFILSDLADVLATYGALSPSIAQFLACCLLMDARSPWHGMVCHRVLPLRARQPLPMGLCDAPPLGVVYIAGCGASPPNSPLDDGRHGTPLAMVPLPLATLWHETPKPRHGILPHPSPTLA